MLIGAVQARRPRHCGKKRFLCVDVFCWISMSTEEIAIEGEEAIVSECAVERQVSFAMLSGENEYGNSSNGHKLWESAHEDIPEGINNTLRSFWSPGTSAEFIELSCIQQLLWLEGRNLKLSSLKN